MSGPTATARGEVDADVAVVGAGLSGLVAAATLAREGVAVSLVEARDRVGGRVLDESIGDGKVVETGAQWIGPSQHRIAALAREVGVDTFPTHTVGDAMAEVGSHLTRFRGSWPDVGAAAGRDLRRAVALLDAMAREVPLEAPWRAACAEPWDAQTFSTWLGQELHTTEARALLASLTASSWAASPGELSLLHVLFDVHAAGGLTRTFGTEGGAQQDRLMGGPELVARRLAERLGERLVLSTPVSRIERRSSAVAVCGNGFSVRARRVIVAMSPALAGRLDYDPPLPGIRQQLGQRMPHGAVVKCFALYGEPFWRAEGLNGEVISEMGPVTSVFDGSPPDGRPGVLVGFILGEAARRLGRAPPAERRREILSCLTRFFGDRAADPEGYLERDWQVDSFTGGGYGGFFGPGGWTGFGAALREPIARLHWAGAETATRWFGYMDGAVSSGERAAAEVLAALSEERSHPT